MKILFGFLKLKDKYLIILTAATILFIFLVSYLSVYIHKNYATHAFDIATINQPTYNTYQWLRGNKNASILEMTTPHAEEDPMQVSRFRYHFDIILIPISLLYFIHAGPETLLVFQAIIVGLGAIPVYLLAELLINKEKQFPAIPLFVSFLYLMYFPMHNAILFMFHPVTLAITFLLFFIYFAITRNYIPSIIFYILSISTKEEVALAPMIYGLILVVQYVINKNRNDLIFGMGLFLLSLVYFYTVMTIFIPHFSANNNYFYISYFSEYGNSPANIFFGVIGKIKMVAVKLSSSSSISYYTGTLGSLGFVSLLGFPYLLPASAEYMINLLSSVEYLNNLNAHYTSVIIPFVFLSLIYGLRFLVTIIKNNKHLLIFCIYIFLFSLTLTLSLSKVINFNKSFNFKIFDNNEKIYVENLALKYSDYNLKLSASSRIAAHVSSRKYFFQINKYTLADIVIIHENDFSYVGKYSSVDKDAIEKLSTDENYKKIESEGKITVYKKINL